MIIAVILTQNFFRSYPKLAGMTGTAATEVAEFNNIYNLNVAVVPTNKASTLPATHAAFPCSCCIVSQIICSKLYDPGPINQYQWRCLLRRQELRAW